MKSDETNKREPTTARRDGPEFDAAPGSAKCTECGKIHSWPHKFRAGDRVRIVGTGVHHNDLSGSVQTIAGPNLQWSMPCDPPEYFLAGFPRGAVAESRMQIFSPSAGDQVRP